MLTIKSNFWQKIIHAPKFALKICCQSYAMKHLPPLNLRYWIMIVSATTLGETAGDLLSMSLHLGYAGGSVALITLFIAALTVELKTRTQSWALYWTVIILASTAGTTISDFITRSLHLGYGWGTLLIACCLMVIMLVWRQTATSVSVRTGFDRRTEFLYWSAILVSSTLGTSFGDLIANGTALGFAGGTMVLAGLLVVVAVLTRWTRLSHTVCYWLAIIITHPIGATMGDSLTKPEGANLGNVWSSVLLVVVFGIVVAAGRFHQTKTL